MSFFDEFYRPSDSRKGILDVPPVRLLYLRLCWSRIPPTYTLSTFFPIQFVRSAWQNHAVTWSWETFRFFQRQDGICLHLHVLREENACEWLRFRKCQPFICHCCSTLPATEWTLWCLGNVGSCFDRNSSCYRSCAGNTVSLLGAPNFQFYCFDSTRSLALWS